MGKRNMVDALHLKMVSFRFAYGIVVAIGLFAEKRNVTHPSGCLPASVLCIGVHLFLYAKMRKKTLN